jgi:peptide/nickel transport system substrate-binding protein
VLAVACGGSAEQSGPAAVEGETTLTVIAAATPDSTALDARAGNDTAFDLTINTQATLIRFPYVKDAETGNLTQDLTQYEGYLAEGYEVDAAGLTYTFKLKPGIMSAAGNPLTADDVVWSFQRKYNAPRSLAPSAFRPAFTDPATQLKKVDDMTVAFTVSAPGFGPQFLEMLSGQFGSIYDSDLLQQNATPEDPFAVTWSQENVNYGFGPYTMTSLAPDQEMIFQARPDAVFGEPEIDRIVYRVGAEAGTRANSLRSGDAQLAKGLLPADLVLLEEEGKQAPTYSDPLSYQTITLKTVTAPMDNKLVRQAFAYAVPYDQIIENVFAGRAEPMSGFLTEDFDGFKEGDRASYSYDPKKAKELLAKAGVSTPVPMTIRTTAAPPENQAMLVQLQSAARDAGFDLSIEIIPTADFYRTMRTDAWPAFVTSNRTSHASPLLDLSLSFEEGSTSNLTKFLDPAYAAIVAELSQTNPADAEKFGELTYKAEQMINEATPYVNIAWLQPTVGLEPKVAGYAYRVEGGIDYSIMSLTE